MTMHYSPLEEGNKLIAEFMGIHIVETPWPHKPIDEQGQWCWKDKYKQFKTRVIYDSSWDLLMPVVEKIEKMGYDSRIHGNNSDGGFICDFVDDENAEWGCAVTHSTKIEAVWLAVIDFIKYYNEQNPKP